MRHYSWLNKRWYNVYERDFEIGGQIMEQQNRVVTKFQVTEISLVAGDLSATLQLLIRQQHQRYMRLLDTMIYFLGFDWDEDSEKQNGGDDEQVD